jgi:hypothetical protein
MKVKINIKDFFEIDIGNNGVAIKSDFSNIVLDNNLAEFDIKMESDWKNFFKELNSRISDYAILFYVKSTEESIKEVSENFKPTITVEIENAKDLKRLEVMCLILRTRMLFVNSLNKDILSLKYLDYQSSMVTNTKIDKHPFIIGLVKLLAICHRLMKNDEIFVDKKYNDIFKNYNVSSENGAIFESKYLIFKDGKVIKYLLDNKIENVFHFISFNIIENAIFDDKKVDLLISLMTLIGIDLNVEEYFNNVEGIIGTKLFLENQFNNKNYYVVFFDLNGMEFYKIGEEFILTDNGKNYSVKESTFNLLYQKRKDCAGDLFTFDIKTMCSEKAKIIEKNNLIEILKSRSKEINNSLKFLSE